MPYEDMPDDQLRAEYASLLRRYKALERVNAELRGELEAWKAGYGRLLEKDGYAEQLIDMLAGLRRDGLLHRQIGLFVSLLEEIMPTIVPPVSEKRAEEKYHRPRKHIPPQDIEGMGMKICTIPYVDDLWVSVSRRVHTPKIVKLDSSCLRVDYPNNECTGLYRVQTTSENPVHLSFVELLIKDLVYG